MSARRKGAGLVPEMNVTPLVDVVLVLLIIFMVVTPQLEAGAAVDLPAAANVDKGEENSLTPTTVSLTSQGALFIDKHEVPRAQLVEKLRGVFEKDPQARVVLKADRAVRYAEVRNVFKTLQDAGFPGISLQVIDLKK
ncbi:biopolymer transport protein, ExbD/TolR family [Cystobacter fuscus DSM 2262]|uniref:Biopolymer transport protein, ExbD/TolR family n=1 Tax=Cystobacter fuscus (strain ATCC 25194 / DSM 2262 / NBRC 100088 / M29) TaxID=1242864 RepID=S9QFL7_CYSF2|nr:biopolymer transporter ExbD [Cystobacter fuscus]EPX55128.1 biopolymer transport protein, ExbD/TolR family [Cystobacter fuscus DSM 2262]